MSEVEGVHGNETGRDETDRQLRAVLSAAFWLQGRGGGGGVAPKSRERQAAIRLLAPTGFDVDTEGAEQKWTQSIRDDDQTSWRQLGD